MQTLHVAILAQAAASLLAASAAERKASQRRKQMKRYHRPNDAPEEEVPKEEYKYKAEAGSAGSSNSEGNLQKIPASVPVLAVPAPFAGIAGVSSSIPRSDVQQKADAVTAAAAPVFAPPVPPQPPGVQDPAESKRLHLQRLNDIAYAKAEGYTVQRQRVPYTLFQPIVTKTKAAEKEDSVKLDEEALQDALSAEGLSAVLAREAMFAAPAVSAAEESKEEEAEVQPEVHTPPTPEEGGAEVPAPPPLPTLGPTPSTPSENGDFLKHPHDPPQAEPTSKKKKVDNFHHILVHKEKFIRLATKDLSMTNEEALSKWEEYEKAPGDPADRDEKGPKGCLRLRLLSIPAASACASADTLLHFANESESRSWLMEGES